MSKADERRAAQDDAALDDLIAMNERPVETPVMPVENRRSWASYCAGWRVGVHERTKEDRLNGIYRCKWCAKEFDPPSEEELQIIRARNLAYERAPHVRRGKW